MDGGHIISTQVLDERYLIVNNELTPNEKKSQRRGLHSVIPALGGPIFGSVGGRRFSKHKGRDGGHTVQQTPPNSMPVI